MMQRFTMVILIFCLAASAGRVRAEESTCTVRYLSAEHVYLDTGSNEGLVVGSKVMLTRGGKAFAELEVVFAAGHSSSCLVEHREGEIKAGDTGLYEPVKEISTSTVVAVVDSVPPPRTRETWTQSQGRQVDNHLKMRGSVALQWDHSNAGPDRELQTDLVSIPFRVRIQKPDQNWIFRARGSLRHITRNGYSSGIPGKEWRNRIREVALLWGDHRLAWNFALGRISTRATASAGPFDGVNISRDLGLGLRLGAFFGFSP